MSERDLQRLLALWERTLGQGWLDVADWLRSLPENSLQAIESRLNAGDVGGLIKEVESAALRLAAEMEAAYTAGARAAANALDEQIADKLIRYDATGYRAVTQARRNQLELVQGLTAEARETVRTVIIDGTRSGVNPRAMARDIQDTISLTPHQAQHVVNYRRALERGDWSNALGRELRDARSDRTLARLARDGGSLSEQQIDRMVARYRDNYIAFRAETVARTEAARNVHAGINEGYQQAIDRGDVETLVKEWLPGPVTRNARSQHRASSLLEQRPKLHEPFVMPDGTRMMYPGDPSGSAEHTANCRCTYAVTIP